MIWKSSKLRNSMRQKWHIFRRSPLVEWSQQGQEKPLARPPYILRWTAKRDDAHFRSFLKSATTGKSPLHEWWNERESIGYEKREAKTFTKRLYSKITCIYCVEEFLEKNTPHTTWVWEKKYFSTWEHCHNTHNTDAFALCLHIAHLHTAHTLQLHTRWHCHSHSAQPVFNIHTTQKKTNKQTKLWPIWKTKLLLFFVLEAN